MKTKKVLAALLAGIMLAAAALSGCSEAEAAIDSEATAVTVDGTEVSLGFVNFVARYEQAQRDDIYVMYLGSDVWQSDSDGDGQTMEAATKAEIMEKIQNWYVLEKKQAEYGVAITDEEKAAIEATAKQFIQDNSKEAIAQMGATEEYVTTMLYYTLLESKMQEAIEEEAVITVTDEDAAQRTFSYILLQSYYGTDEDGNYVTYTDEEIEEYLKNADAVIANAKEDFDAVAEEYGYTDATYSYSANDEELDEGMREAANALSEGEVSDLVETSDGYYVIRLDSEYDAEASAKNKSNLIAAEKLEYYEAQLAEMMAASEITVDEDMWAQVKFDTLFTIKTSEE